MYRSRLCACATALLAVPAVADVPAYETIQLQCRSNFTVNGGAFNLPDNIFFNSATPALNDSRQVSVNLAPVGSGHGVWFGQDGMGGVAYTSPGGASISNVSINSLGFVVFPQVFSSPDGIFFYDDSDGSSGFLTDQPIGAFGWSSPQVNDSGNVGVRASFFGDNAYYVWNGTTATLYAAEVDVDAGSPYSFIFTPSFNNADQIAAKVRLGGPGEFGESQPDHIVIFSGPGSSTLIAEDVDSNEFSPYASFDNGVSLTNNGWVAFFANLVAGGSGVFISNGTTTLTIATTNDPEIDSIDAFNPAANDNHLVAFRAFDADGFRTIFVGDGTTLTRVVTEHDILSTDLGDARVDQNDTSPVFGGSPTINNNGDVAFNASLTPPDDNQIEWGSGIFVAIASQPCPANLDDSDNVVNVNDLLALFALWGPCPAPCAADLAAPAGVVDVNDLLALFADWGNCP